MIKYNGQLNMGNAALGSEKSISANEVCDTVDAKYIAEEINHLNPLIPPTVAEDVLKHFCKSVSRLMAMGFCVQLKSGNDVAMRIHPDIHVKGGNISLARAQQLDPTVTELTTENAGDLIDKAGGVTLRVAADVQMKFNELLKDEKPTIERKGIVVSEYVERKNASESGSQSGSDAGGSDNNGSGDNGSGSGGDGDDQGGDSLEG